jgi:uridine monophosphate synthetase
MLWIMMKYLVKFARNVLLLSFLFTCPLQSFGPQKFINHLFDIGVFKFGNFTLKSGKPSSFYIDMRVLISHPLVLKEAISGLWEIVDYCDYDHICGVPYSALVIASGLCVTHDQPMLLKRKETKEYGTKKLIEGTYRYGDRCLLIEDIITSGQSILETATQLQEHGLVVNDAVVLIDRQESGIERVKEHGLQVHALFTIGQIAACLYQSKRITYEQAESLCSNSICAYNQFAELILPSEKFLTKLLEKD